MSKVRVLVVDDSLTVRRHFIDALQADADIEVVGEAGDGKRAIELCRELRPDVISLDMMLPLMTGLAATEYIMAYCPTPILIVSASMNRGELFKTYEALAAGAVDVLEKPSMGVPGRGWEERFISTLKLVSRIKVVTRHRSRPVRAEAPGALEPAGRPRPRRAVAIGASTGGPSAIVEVLRRLPAPFPLPVLFVLHIGAPFGAAFADWLDGQTPHRVSVAEDGQALDRAAGRVLVAPPDRHLVLSAGRLRLTEGPERNWCRPSIDELFDSLARELGAASAACLLTGMGRDGAAGLLAIRAAGGATIAQDEATSVVYGMPREAAALGGAERILPLGDIGQALAAACGPAPLRGTR